MEVIPISILILLALYGVGVLLHRHLSPTYNRPRVIEALEENERLGLSDIDRDVSRTAYRWNMLCLGSEDAERMQIIEYKQRIDAQLKVLEPRSKELQDFTTSQIAGYDYLI